MSRFPSTQQCSGLRQADETLSRVCVSLWTGHVRLSSPVLCMFYQLRLVHDLHSRQQVVLLTVIEVFTARYKFYIVLYCIVFTVTIHEQT